MTHVSGQRGSERGSAMACLAEFPSSSVPAPLLGLPPLFAGSYLVGAEPQALCPVGPWPYCGHQLSLRRGCVRSLPRRPSVSDMGGRGCEPLAVTGPPQSWPALSSLGHSPRGLQGRSDPGCVGCKRTTQGPVLACGASIPRAPAQHARPPVHTGSSL